MLAHYLWIAFWVVFAFLSVWVCCEVMIRVFEKLFRKDYWSALSKPNPEEPDILCWQQRNEVFQAFMKVDQETIRILGEKVDYLRGLKIEILDDFQKLFESSEISEEGKGLLLKTLKASLRKFDKEPYSEGAKNGKAR